MAGISQPSKGGIAFFSKDKIVYELKSRFGDVSHLSTHQLEKLIRAIPDLSEPATQAPSVGNEEWSTTVRSY